ncbi:DNA helicase/exodeoxyribonuclease V, gamma subunit [Tessaracoccus bendigoensis DSM 12906]|uniref:DNA helicase/exodeoxyribonuclease V, gamma subunit n=1 Tax=Tessaracoccus bendigoensis DSM 12906 TaxID=1123357 RepID=A0A1M6KU91_9ACTN|nr:exodeoxyribonuclease V subunit gamma [Tessaracoccus bendigoensis]SHJ62434.1 DNA helicase/exodeoxyribonuclease V, gamma subunit [Tessaracoccus bendigoensis DSM 12906]
MGNGRGEGIVQGRRWSDLLDRLAEQLRQLPADPFKLSRVVVSSAATGRIVGQEVAARLGISAGISYPPPERLMAELAERAGVARDRSRWLGTPLDLATWEAIDALASEHPVLARAADGTGSRRATAGRLARLQRWYVNVAPDLIAAWLHGSDTGADGAPLPERWAWQPALLRATVDALEVDPLETLAAIVEAASVDPTPTILFAVDDLTTPQQKVVEALPGLTEIAADEAVDGPRAEVDVALHDSHGPARQVEVLRDELTRAFEADPTLEPRQVAIICPRPERYAQLLDAAFSPATDGAHPGRGLRVQPVARQSGNPTLVLLATLLRLGELRASASQLVDLLLEEPIEHRWLLDDRQAIIELVGGAGVHWGMDADHRAVFALDGLAQNTWLRGLDRLLIGLSVAPGHHGGLALAGADVVESSDLQTVGALCEIVSRLRRLVAQTAVPATIPEWVARSRSAISDLLGCPQDEQWQLMHAHTVLTRLENDHLGSGTLLTRGEFAHLLTGSLTSARARVAAGNGSLMVAPLGELRHVEHRLVALLGVTDDVVPGGSGQLPDSVDLGGLVPDQRQLRLQQLLGHARSAPKLVIVRQAYSQRSNDPVPAPAAISWLLEELGVAPEPIRHPPTASSEANYEGSPSFDPAGHAGALARRQLTSRAAPVDTARTKRRRQALTRPVGRAPQQVTLGQLGRFLADPAKAFLRSAVNLPLYSEPELADEMPLGLSGLSQWQVVNSLLDALKQDRPLDSVIRRLLGDEQLPADEIGRSEFNRAREQAEKLWAEASGAWHADVVDVPVDLQFDLPVLGQLRLIDEVRCRGGASISVTPSHGLDKLIPPWLESLALTASGTPTPGRLFRLIKDPTNYRSQIVDTRTVGQPDPGAAMTRLSTVLRAYVLGQYRLIPAPATAAIRYADDVGRSRLDARQWRGAPGYRHPKVDRFGPAWALFYDDEVAELFTDRPNPEDPTNGQESAFGAWAVALYGDLLGGN